MQMENNFNNYETVYWVFTQLCNDKCDHCYNSSGPQGNRMSDEDCLNIIGNLPDKVNKIILSGGEPLAERKQLYLILDALTEKYGINQKITLQTNGDLMTSEILDTLLKKGVKGISIASLDRFHKHAGAKLDGLKTLFDLKGMVDVMPYINIGEKKGKVDPTWITYSYFGANEEMWLGGNWARGRAFENDIWMKDPAHNFCNIQSGARNFLGGYTDVIQEVCIQLWALNPCCPGTKYPLGDIRKEKLATVLERISKNKIFQVLNTGNPLKMGEHIGITEEQASKDNEVLQNICRYCDLFFIKNLDPHTLEPLNKI